MTTKSRARYRRALVEDVVPRSESVSDMSARQYKSLLECVRELGQLRPIVVREMNGKSEVIDGGFLLTALTEVGFKKVDILDLGMVSDERAHEIHLVLNLNRGKPKPAPLANILEQATNGDVHREIRVWKELPLTGKSVTHVVTKLRSKIAKPKPVKHNPKAQSSFVDFKMRVPPDAAKVCDAALGHIEANNGVKRPRAFELMCADYISQYGSTNGP